MKALWLALRFAPRRSVEALSAVASVALGSGSLAVVACLYRENLLSRSDGTMAWPSVFGALALGTALVSAIGFAFILRGRMHERRKGYAMLKAVGSTSLSLFATLVIEAFALALGGAILSLSISLPLMILAGASVSAGTRALLGAAGMATRLDPGFLAVAGLGFAMLIALFSAIPALETTMHCFTEETTEA